MNPTIAAAVALAAGLVAAGPAQAANRTPGCVTRAEFRKVGDGDYKYSVRKAFGTRGRQVYASYGGRGVGNYEIREYRACTPHGYVQVTYRNSWLESKMAFF